MEQAVVAAQTGGAEGGARGGGASRSARALDVCQGHGARTGIPLGKELGVLSTGRSLRLHSRAVRFRDFISEFFH